MVLSYIFLVTYIIEIELFLVRRFARYISGSRHPSVTQSVAMIHITDGLEEEVSFLTVFTNVAREVYNLSNTFVKVFYLTGLFFCVDYKILQVRL